MKWREKGWKIFKSNEISYINKANQILIDEKSFRNFGPINEGIFSGMYDEFKA